MGTQMDAESGARCALCDRLAAVQVLQLSHNAMEVTPIGLLSLTALTYLDLSYNRLMSLPFWIGSSKLQQLQRLNLVRVVCAPHVVVCAALVTCVTPQRRLACVCSAVC